MNAAFRKMTQIEGDKLVMHAKAHRNENVAGRPSRGLAIWVHNSRNNSDNMPQISITNAYCKLTLTKTQIQGLFRKFKLSNHYQGGMQILIKDLNAKAPHLGDKNNGQI